MPKAAAPSQPTRWPHGLCPTQRAVLAAVIRGRTAKEAASEMRISPETYRGYRKTLLRRAGVSSGAELQGHLLCHLLGADIPARAPDEIDLLAFEEVAQKVFWCRGCMEASE